MIPNPLRYLLVTLTLLSVPSLIRIEVHGETTRLTVEEGAATCQGETGTLMRLANKHDLKGP